MAGFERRRRGQTSPKISTDACGSDRAPKAPGVGAKIQLPMDLGLCVENVWIEAMSFVGSNAPTNGALATSNRSLPHHDFGTLRDGAKNVAWH